MTIHEQITALLDGELVDGGAVAELMHVLAVSPEKRELLVDQLSMKRYYTASAAQVVPPASADLAIMRGLASVDASVAAGAPPDEIKRHPASAVPVPVVRRVLLASAALMAIL